MRTIRASEVGTFLYCQRAWWYAQKGYPNENQVELAIGSEIHERHGRVVMVSSCLQFLAYALLLLGLILITIYVTRWMLSPVGLSWLVISCL
jgi:hypothetical protein